MHHPLAPVTLLFEPDILCALVLFLVLSAALMRGREPRLSTVVVRRREVGASASVPSHHRF